MIMLDDYQELLRTIDRITQAVQEKKGAEKQIKKRIKQDFGLKSIKAAKRKTASLLKEEHKITDKYIPAKKGFEKSWRKLLKKYSSGS